MTVTNKSQISRTSTNVGKRVTIAKIYNTCKGNATRNWLQRLSSCQASILINKGAAIAIIGKNETCWIAKRKLNIGWWSMSILSCIQTVSPI